MASQAVEAAVDRHPGGLLLSGSDDFDQLSLNARAVLDGAIERHTAAGLDGDLLPRGESALRWIYDRGLNAYLYGQNGIGKGGMSAAHVAATFEHTPDKEHPYVRLVGTGVGLDTIFTGTRAEGIHEAKRLYLGHKRVRGYFRGAVGPYPAGTPYSAHDPNMMKYTGVRILGGLFAIDEQTHGPLPDYIGDAACQDGATAFELLGLAREEFPQTRQELRDYETELQESGELQPSDTSEYFGKEILLNLPLPLLGVLLARHTIINPTQRAALDEHTRETYGIRYNRLDELRAKAAALGIRAVGATPDSLRARGVEPAFRLIERTEASYIRHNQAHPIIPEYPY